MSRTNAEQPLFPTQFCQKTFASAHQSLVGCNLLAALVAVVADPKAYAFGQLLKVHPHNIDISANAVAVVRIEHETTAVARMHHNEVDIQRLVNCNVVLFEFFEAILPCSDDCNFPSTLCFDDIAFSLRSRNEKAEAYEAKSDQKLLRNAWQISRITSLTNLPIL